MYREAIGHSRIVQSPERAPPRSTNVSKLAIVEVGNMGSRTKSSALFHDPHHQSSRDVCFNEIFRDVAVPIEKKDQTFSKMVGRDKISSVRKG